MRILLVHNYYQHAGGEDRVFADEADLLTANGHEVVRYTVDNDGLESAARLRLAVDTVWNRQSAAEIGSLVKKGQIEVAHFHNTLPRISPSAYYAARRSGAAVVQSLHNFRLLCPNATFLREGSVCEKCLGHAVAWPAIKHRCYRNSLGASTVLTGMLAAHRLLNTWRKAVDAYITLTEFARQRFVTGGLPADKLHVKPNFVLDPPPAGSGDGGYLLFVGRLSTEKGIATLLEAWNRLPQSIRLRIVGDGPMADDVRRAAAAHPGIEWLGSLPPAEVAHQMAGAAGLVIPSICYENLPKALVESFAAGTPILASRLGALPDLVDDGRTGLLFTAGDSQALAACVEDFLSDAGRCAAMRRAARAEFELRYTADDNHRQLMTIYESALERQCVPGLARRDFATQGASG